MDSESDFESESSDNNTQTPVVPGTPPNTPALFANNSAAIPHQEYVKHAAPDAEPAVVIVPAPPRHSEPTEEVCTTRLISPDEFKMLYRDNIARAHHIERPPDEIRRFERPSTGTSARSPQRLRPVSSAPFIDPYNRTKWNRRIVIPSNAFASSRRAASNQPSSATALRLKQRVRNAKTMDFDDDLIMRMTEELNSVKQNLRQKEQTCAALKTEVRKLEERASRTEHDMLRNRPAKEAQTVEALVESLKNKVASLELQLTRNDDELQQVRRSAKASKLAELQNQCNVYLAESRRMQRLVEEMNSTARAGVEGTALQEAAYSLRNKDHQMAVMQEKVSALREEASRCSSDAAYWKKQYEDGRVALSDMTIKVDELKQAPLEITRLRTELDDARRREESVTMEMKQLQSTHNRKLELARADAQTSGMATAEAITVERDALLKRVQTLQQEIDSLRRDTHEKVVLSEQSVEKRIRDKVSETTLLAQDREQALRNEMKEVRSNCTELEKQLRVLQDKHKEEIEQLRVKDQQRQENLLITMGKYERERQAQELRVMQERESLLAQQKDEMEQERKQWEQQIRLLREEIADLQKHQHTAPTPAPSMENSHMRTASSDTRGRMPAHAPSGSRDTDLPSGSFKEDRSAYQAPESRPQPPVAPARVETASSGSSGTAGTPTPTHPVATLTKSPANKPMKEVPQRYPARVVDDEQSEATVQRLDEQEDVTDEVVRSGDTFEEPSEIIPAKTTQLQPAAASAAPPQTTQPPEKTSPLESQEKVVAAEVVAEPPPRQTTPKDKDTSPQIDVVPAAKPRDSPPAEPVRPTAAAEKRPDVDPISSDDSDTSNESGSDFEIEGDASPTVPPATAAAPQPKQAAASDEETSTDEEVAFET